MIRKSSTWRHTPTYFPLWRAVMWQWLELQWHSLNFVNFDLAAGKWGGALRLSKNNVESRSSIVMLGSQSLSVDRYPKWVSLGFFFYHRYILHCEVIIVCTSIEVETFVQSDFSWLILKRFLFISEDIFDVQAAALLFFLSTLAVTIPLWKSCLNELS